MSELRLALGTAIGPGYLMEREVRPVGGCRLFVALELPAGSELLVKVLPGELSLALDPARFERELLSLRDRLGDSNLVSPRGSGRAGAFVYHTRRFVEGTTLRSLLTRQGELPLHRAVEILRSVLSVLAHAHEKNVVHGDLKPENVLLTEGQVLVVDTGVVEAVGRSLMAAPPDSARLALCSPAYVPPEQPGAEATGPGPADDLYAVGVLAHEMLTGQPPVPEGEALDEVRTLPPWFGDLIRGCLAAGPAQRWGDAAAVLNVLSRGTWGR